MIAIAMYVSLGGMVTLLLALLILPMIWRRAVRLTEKRIMAEMPISYSELQAEKDMQRAEQAVELRRLEVLADHRHEEVANKSLKIDRLTMRLSERDQTITDRLADIEGLKTDLSNQKQKTADTETQLSERGQELAAAQGEIETLETIKANQEAEIEELDTHLNEQKIDAAAQMARLESSKQEISELSANLKTESDLLAETKGLLAQRNSEAERARERLDKQQSKIDELQSSIADKDSEIDTLTRRLERAQEQNNAKSDDSSERLAEAETRRIEAEAKIASMSLQLEHHEDSEDGTDLGALVTSLQKEKTELTSALKDAHQIIDKLDRKVKETAKKAEKAKTNAPSESPLSDGERALRDELKAIAVQITEAAAKQEGPTSPIPALLGQPPIEAADSEDKAHEEASVEKVIDTGEDKATTAASDNSADRPAQLATNTDKDAEVSPAPDTGSGSGSAPDQAKEQEADQNQETDNVTPMPAKSPWDEVFSLTDRLKQMRKSREDKNAAS